MCAMCASRALIEAGFPLSFHLHPAHARHRWHTCRALLGRVRPGQMPREDGGVVFHVEGLKCIETTREPNEAT